VTWLHFLAIAVALVSLPASLVLATDDFQRCVRRAGLPRWAAPLYLAAYPVTMCLVVIVMFRRETRNPPQ
jgi:cytosine/uracil/thiamine/allantoin permease